MWGPMELMCWRNWWLCSTCWMTKVSSTYLSHSLGGLGAEVMVLDSNSSRNMLAMGGQMRGTHGCAVDLFKLLLLKEEVGIFQAKLQYIIICGMNMEVLWEGRGSCRSLLLTIEMTGSTGTDVKRALAL